MNKPKKNYKAEPSISNPRDNFQTPRYATELLIPYIPKNINLIWECAAGEHHIVRALLCNGYNKIFASDIQGYGVEIMNFLTSKERPDKNTAIITNPPYSLKKKFFFKCLEYDIPFALLIPADYSQWIISAIRVYGCKKLVPTRRIDYITPTGKKSSAQFHSMWLCKDFDLPEQETFVELTNQMKENI